MRDNTQVPFEEYQRALAATVAAGGRLAVTPDITLVDIHRGKGKAVAAKVRGYAWNPNQLIFPWGCSWNEEEVVYQTCRSEILRKYINRRVDKVLAAEEVTDAACAAVH